MVGVRAVERFIFSTEIVESAEITEGRWNAPPRRAALSAAGRVRMVPDYIWAGVRDASGKPETTS
jgi:hypothetical protein